MRDPQLLTMILSKYIFIQSTYRINSQMWPLKCKALKWKFYFGATVHYWRHLFWTSQAHFVQQHMLPTYFDTSNQSSCNLLVLSIELSVHVFPDKIYSKKRRRHPQRVSQYCFVATRKSQVVFSNLWQSHLPHKSLIHAMWDKPLSGLEDRPLL